MADRNALPTAKPKAIHTEVRSGGMDIGCFQVERVLQDVEQKVREKGRKEAVRDRGRRTAEFDCADLHCVVRVVVRQRSRGLAPADIECDGAPAQVQNKRD